MVNWETRTTDALTELQTFTGTAGTASKMQVLHRSFPGDMGGGTFEWDNTSTQVADGAIFLQVPGVATGRWRRIHDNDINVCWFGAVGDNATDCTVAFQAAYEYASSMTMPAVTTPLTSPTVYVPPGTYRVGALIWGQGDPVLGRGNRNNEIGLRGAGQRKSTLRALSTTAFTLTLGKPSAVDFSGRWTVSDLTFHGGTTGFGGVDMANCRYATLERCEFHSWGVGGTGVRASRWGNNLVDLTMFFDHVAGTIGITVITTAPYGAVNGFNINNVKINGAEIGIRMSSPNLANITNCTLDQCRGTAIYIPGGCKGLNVDHNYFEACGQDGITITRSGPSGDVTETYYGAIVAHNTNAAPSASPISGLYITNNMFAAISGADKTVITLSGVEDCVIENNQTLQTYNNDSFVELRWLGALYSQVRNFVIDHGPQDDANLTQLVKFNTDNNLTSCNNIVIKDRRLFSFIKQHYLPILNEPHRWLSALPWANLFEEAPYEGFAVHRLPAGSTQALGGKSYTVNLLSDAMSSWKGAYFRVNFRSKGAVGLPAGFLLRLYVDEVEAWTLLNPTEDWGNVGRGYCFMIPKTATTIRFYIAPNTLTRDVFLTQFSIVPAAVDLSPSYAMKPTELAGIAYYGSGNPEGPQVAIPGKLYIRENGTPGRQLYVKETATDGTGWKPVRTGAGVIQSNTNGAATLVGNVVNYSDAWQGTNLGATGFPTAPGTGQIVTWNGIGSTVTDYARVLSWWWPTIDDGQELWYQRYSATGVPQGWRQVLTDADAGSGFSTLATFFNTVSNASTTPNLYEVFYTATIPANTLTANGHRVTGTYAGVYAANANTKGLNLSFDGNVVGPPEFAQSGGSWHFEVTVMRTGTGTIRVWSKVIGLDHSEVQTTTAIAGIDFTADIAFSLMGAGGGSAGDVSAQMGEVIIKK